MIIPVKEVVTNAFSSAQAQKLREEIQKNVDANKEIVLDFEGVNKFTTLFFNFSTGYFINKLGKEKYDKVIKVINLSALGESTYNNSYANAIRDEISSDEINDEIINILQGQDEN